MKIKKIMVNNEKPYTVVVISHPQDYKYIKEMIMTYRFYIWAFLNFINIKTIIDIEFNNFSNIRTLTIFNYLFLIILNFPSGIILLFVYPILNYFFPYLNFQNYVYRPIIFISEAIIPFILGYIQWFVLIPYLKEKRRKK